MSQNDGNCRKRIYFGYYSARADQVVMMDCGLVHGCCCCCQVELFPIGFDIGGDTGGSIY